MAASPDVGSRIDRRFDCCDLLHRNVAPKASSVTLTTRMVATPSRGWKPRLGLLIHFIWPMTLLPYTVLSGLVRS